MASFDNRVFLAALADIRDWGGRSATVLNTLEKTDVIFLLDGGEELSTAQKNLLQNMKKKAEVKMVELSGQAPGEAGLHILREYLKKEETKKNVYLIGKTMEELQEQEENLADACKTLTFHKNFQVKQIRKEKEPQELNGHDRSCDGRPQDAGGEQKTAGKAQGRRKKAGEGRTAANA